ncbi:unnamed protein product [Cyprideis torosa]|uniref:methenyltetrahydrofolate cyclohydrolase n=1 Tax=Cyprideis torosa TaxID=163714 RepID=A0A7R8WNW1_9CRUS|nr:unnamed protein product [Cyprideis torosa]CAG0900883.1 unnamed protein product [Cyprideis torosa]
MQILNGLELSKTIKSEIKEEVDMMVASGDRPPHLVAVLVGEDGASQTYVNNKIKSCRECGYESTLIKKDKETTEEELIRLIKRLNVDDHTPDIQKYSKEADILIVAVGKPNFVTKDMVKEGAIVFDVGITRVEDKKMKRGYRIVGDVDFESVAPITSYITPVPGGVGPMTVTMLLYNTLLARKKTVSFNA